MVSSDFECYLMLIDPNGNVVTFDDNFPARISNFKLKTSGTYTIEATATGFAPGRGGYFLSLDPLPSLTVLSSNPSNGVLVVETPSDADGEFNGITQFTRFYANNTVVALTAPLTAGGNPFSMWNGCDNTTGTTCTVTMSADKTVTAVYVTPAAITLTYGQTLLDRVGQSNQTRGDGRLDPTFIVTFPTGGATRTVTSLRLDGTSNGGTWDTNGGTGFWTVGVARDLGSGLLNSADDSVNFTVAPGSSFVIFVSDWFLGAPFPNGLFRPGNEFKVTIGFSDNTIATAMAIITAQPVPSVVINDTSVIEGNTGMTNAVFTLNLSAASNQFVTVYYSTADGSATAGSDYVAISGVYTFQPGETSKAVTISVIGDTVVEADETFFVNLGVALNAVIARGQGTGTIINDDLGGSAVWAPVAPMNIRRTAHTATRLKDGRVLVAGGLTETAVVSSAEIYNPATNAWTQVGGMSTARGYHTANLLPDGRVLVAGGAATNTTSLSSAEIFNPATNSWTPATSMSTPRDDHTATLLSDGRVLVAGGENVQTGLPYTTLSSAEIYDPATNVWSPTPSMQFDRVAHADTLLSDSRVLVTGGLGTDSTRSEIYNPNTNNWSLAGAMTTGRIDHVAALLPNGTAIVTGGETDSGPTASVEAYNPFSRNWTSATPMSIGRSSLHTATLISNGGLLVTGGNIGGENSSSSAEIYNSDLNIWTNTVSMNAKRRFHAATLLLDGSVLVTGGQDGLTPLSSAEVFSTGQPVSPSISLRFDGVLRDRVGQGEFAQNADGQLDGVFNVSLNPGSGTRTITKLHLTNTPGGAWNTQGGDGFWTLGVATGFDAGLLNAANDAVNFLVPQGDSFKIFASDFQNLEYAKGTTFTLTVTFSDGTTATAAALIGN
jgi:N-acetylneuraminic acid mutarotase